MIPPASPALEQALAALRSPGLLPRLRERRLPQGVVLLLRVAAGDSQARSQACSMADEPEGRVVEAAELFVQQVLFHPGSDSYRVLGVEPDADEAQIKEHYRWLVRWVHPDRHGEDWNSVYADRVTAAWQDLRTAERRMAYDRRGATPMDAGRSSSEFSAVPAGRSFGGGQAEEGFQLSARAVRRLPVLILGVLLLGAVTFLALQAYVVRLEQESELAETDEVPPSPMVDEQALSAALAARQLPPAAPAKSPASALAAPAPVPAPAPLPTQAEPPVLSAAGAGIARTTYPIVPIELPPPIEATAPAKPANRGRAVPLAEATSAPPARQVLATERPARPARIRNRPAVAATAAADETDRKPASPAPKISSSRPQRQAPVLIDAAIAGDLMRQFRSAYASGNINQVHDLLASEALAQRRERKRILKSYSRLFEASQRRHINLSNVSWLTEGDTAILIASFEAFIVPVDEEEGHWVSGDIRFDMQEEDGRLRIIKLRHESKPG